MNMSRKCILASGSPRRIEIMRANGIDPLIMPAKLEENIPPVCGMCETVMFLALKKAKWVEEKYLNETLTDFTSDLSVDAERSVDFQKQAGKQTAVILAADTIVYKDGIMGKPKDRQDAFRMLSLLRNDVHYVVTGVTLVEAGCQNARVFAEVTKVFVKDFTDEQLNAYLDTDEPYDKAGGYAIQGLFGKYIDHIEGSYANVVGFPWEKIVKALGRL